MVGSLSGMWKVTSVTKSGQVLQVERSRIGLTLAIRGFVLYFVQLRIAKVNPILLLSTCSTWPDFVTEVTFHIPESDPTIEFQWYQVGDPDRIKSYGSALVWQNPFTLYTFIDGPAQYYGIFSYKGYSVRTDVLTVRELVCDHPGVDADNRCSQCRAEVAASVELNGSTGYYLSLSEALALARTDAYRGCTLTILRSSTDPISVNSGSFTLTAAQGVMLGGKVTLAKDAAVTLSGGELHQLRQHLRAQPHRRRHLLRCRGPAGRLLRLRRQLPRRRHHLRHRDRYRRYLHR